jgi:hypothetical protein
LAIFRSLPTLFVPAEPPGKWLWPAGETPANREKVLANIGQRRDEGWRDEGWRDEGWRDEGWRDEGWRDEANVTIVVGPPWCSAGGESLQAFFG